jgi:heterodisulfide reductase subunit B
MKYALFIGCTIPRRVEQYDLSARAVLGHLGVELVDIKAFKCCGYPIRNSDSQAFALFSARNLALAEAQGLDILTLCKCCFGSLKKVRHLLANESGLKDETNKLLAKEGLEYHGEIEVKHYLSVLHKEIGVKTLKDKVSRPFEKLKIATHYGCHALRPSDITEFDNPVAPILFDELVNVTGAKSIDWSLKLDCCGAPVMGQNDDLSTDLTQKKLDSGREAGADYLCVGCPWCQVQFDQVQAMISARQGSSKLPSLVYPQLLGLAMGLDKEELGLNQNIIDISAIENFYKKEKKEKEK